MIPEELEDKLDYLANTKELLRQKLNEKGVTVSSSDTFRSYANKILELPTLAVESIEAVYTQSGTVYDTDSLDSLKSDLVVTAIYNSGATEVVTDYTLSGTLTAGTSTITVSYDTFTDTFDVTVTASITYLYKWDFTQSMVDSVQGLELTLGKNATRDSSGVHFTGKGDRINWVGTFDMDDKVFEIDIASMDFQGNTSYDMNFFVVPATWSDYSCILCFDKNGGWGVYNADTSYFIQTRDRNLFNQSTIKLVVSKVSANVYNFKLYKNDILIGTVTSKSYIINGNNVAIGSANRNTASNGDQCYNMTITGVRIYANQ